jgi:hypothetical protein
MFTIALLVSALPLLAHANVSFNKGDFIAAHEITRNGEVLVSVKLSKSGKAKVKKLNREAVGEAVHMEVGDVAKDFTLKVPIKGESLEMGPYSPSDAERVVSAINHRK